MTQHDSPLFAPFKAISNPKKSGWIWAMFSVGKEGEKSPILPWTDLFKSMEKTICVNLMPAWEGSVLEVFLNGSDPINRIDKASELERLAKGVESWGALGSWEYPVAETRRLNRGEGDPVSLPGGSASKDSVVLGQSLSESERSKKPHEESALVFGASIPRIRRALQAMPELHDFLKSYYTRRFVTGVSSAADLTDWIFKDSGMGLVAALVGTYKFLKERPDQASLKGLRELLGLLSAVAADPEWIRSVRTQLQKQGDGPGARLIQVPSDTSLQVAEMLKASLDDEPALWTRVEPKTAPVGEDGFHSLVESRGTALSPRLDEVRQFIKRRLGIPPGVDPTHQELEERTLARKLEGRRVYMLFQERDVLAGAVAAGNSIPSRHLLLFQRAEAEKEIIRLFGAIAQPLQDILDLIDPKPAHGGSSAT